MMAGRRLSGFWFWAGVLSLLTGQVWALDNPDAPDLLTEFHARERVHMQAIEQPENTGRDYLRAYHRYQQFLDTELNVAYQALMSHLDETAKQALKQAQRDWLAFRDAEFEFIDHNWSRDRFGSSAGMSRGAYRCELIRRRVEQLLAYAMNY